MGNYTIKILASIAAGQYPSRGDRHLSHRGVEVPDPSVPFDVRKMILNRWSEFHRKAEGGYNAVES